MPARTATRRPTRTLLEPGYHPVYARMLCTVVAERNIDSTRVLAAAGLTEADVGAAAIRVSHVHMSALIDAVRTLCDDPCIALEWGARLGNTVHGIAGAAYLSSRDVRQAMTVLCAVLALRSTTVHASVIETDKTAWLEFSEALPMHDTRHFLMAAAAVMLTRLLEAVLGRASAQLSIALPLPSSYWASACAGYFPSPAQFDAPTLRFGMPVEFLARPCPTADPDAHAAALRQCALDTMHLSGKLATRLGAYLAQQTGEFPTLETAAGDFCLSPRTFSRMLSAEGTSYQALLDAARLELAQRYLRQTNLSVDQIAERLGYADTSNFIRAFRRWCQRTPQQDRKAYRKH